MDAEIRLSKILPRSLRSDRHRPGNNNTFWGSTPVVNRIKHFTLVNYDSRVVI